MLSAEMTNILTLLSAAPSDPADIEALRAAYDLLGQMMGPIADVERTAGELGGVPGEWFTPVGTTPERTILHLHGGGFVMGSRTSHQALASALADAAEARVFLAEYRLAPEHQYPAALDDAVEVYRALIQDTDPTTIALAGDSAGGNLVLTALLRLRDHDVPLPAAVALVSPWTDLTQSGATITSIGDDDPLLRPAMLDHWAELYLAGAPDHVPSTSPLFADLAGLPPLLIHVGARECLLDDSRRLAARAQDAGVEVELVVADEMIHHWHLFGAGVPESALAIGDLASWIRSRTPA